MSTRAWMRTAVVGCALIVGNSGCFLDQYRQEQMAGRKARAQNEEFAKELLDARTTVRSLKDQLNSRDGELASMRESLDTLRGQVASFDEARRSAQAALEDFMKRGPGDPIVITQKLPDELDRALKQFAADYPDKVEYIPEQGSVRWKSDLLFELGSAEVRAEAKPSLEDFARIVNLPEAMAFEPLIIGHTDNKPIKRPETMRRHPTNWHLSSHRAISVMEILHGFGVQETRMVVAGCGEWRPVSDNASGPSAQAKNRRVEIYLVQRNRQPAEALTPGAGEGSKI